MGLQDQQSDYNSWYGNSGQAQIDQALFDEWWDKVNVRHEELGVHFDQSYQDKANAAAARLNAFNEYRAAQEQRTELDAELQRLTQELNPALADVNEGLRSNEEANALQERQKAEVQQSYEEVQRLTQELNSSLADVNEDLYSGIKASNRDIVVDAELVKTADGRLVAVARLPDLSFELDQAIQALEKSPLDVAIDQIRSGAITTSDLLDVRKYMLPLAAQTLMNSDVLMAGLSEKFKSKNIAGQESSKAKFVNKAGNEYPEVFDLRTGKNIHYPEGDLQKVPKDQRVEWNNQTRVDYIKEWYNRGYETPEGGWEKYDIHHIRPREYGGDNSFRNLVPVERSLHQNEFNKFWLGF